jgi:1-acyl-sn-glycerol-3-phosphate acyltransferase
MTTEARGASLSSHAARMTRLYRWLCLDRVAAPTVPAGPGIVLAAHYNGLIDGFTYSALSPHIQGVVSAQWHRSALGRFLLPGIAVTRSKDQREGEGAGGNVAAFKAMLAALHAGEILLFFPEGTSCLGPQRLPVQRGTELLLRLARGELPELPVYFTAANYEALTAWRGRVAIALDGPYRVPEAKAGLSDWVAAGLLRAQDQALARTFPPRPDWLPPLRRGLARLALLPLLPAWLAARWAIRHKADDSNVISLWRMLGGVPAALLCWLAWAGAAMVLGAPWLALAVPVSSLVGVALWIS